MLHTRAKHQTKLEAFSETSPPLCFYNISMLHGQMPHQSTARDAICTTADFKGILAFDTQLSKLMQRRKCM